MTCSDDVGLERRRYAVAVIDGDVPDGGWQELDIRRTLESLNAVSEVATATPDVAMIALSLESASSPFGQEPSRLHALFGRQSGKRIPADAFVSIGSPKVGATGPKLRRPSSQPGPSANDNHASGEQRSVWRDLFFLMVLLATVVGAFLSGKVQGYQKVIVVPAPSSFYSVVT